MQLEELKIRYDKQTIDDIEKDITTNKETSVKAEKAFIMRLYYLESTKRFRENRDYQRAEFKEYVDRKWGMTYNQYFNLRMAWITFEVESVAIGPNMVAKAIKTCGARKAPKAIAELTAKAKKGDGSVRQEEFREILQKHTETPTATITKSNVNWKAMYQQKCQEVERLKGLARELEKENLHLKEENGRLRAAFKKLHGITSIIDVGRPQPRA